MDNSNAIIMFLLGAILIGGIFAFRAHRRSVTQSEDDPPTNVP